MKTDYAGSLVTRSKRSPTVEIDTEASAAYVRFKRARVARTVRHSSKWPIATFDLDARGELVGVEFVGVKRFDLAYLLKHVGINLPAQTVAHASYVSAEVDSTPA